MQAQENRVDRLTAYIRENQDKFYKLAYNYVRDKELAFDVIQDAIVKALNKIESLRQIEYMQTWFYRILINECLTNIKKNKIQGTFINIEDYDISYLDKDISQSMDVYNAVNQLNEKLRTVIILRFFENMKIEEIARVINTNVNTVKSRLYKGLKELKLYVEEEEGDEQFPKGEKSL